MLMPLLRNASSRSRWESISKLKSRLGNISESGLKVTRVPVCSERPISFSGACAAPVLLLVDLAVALDLDFQGFGEGIDDRKADAVKAAGDFIRRLVEFAAGVELREHDLGRGDFLRRMETDGNAAAVVDHGHAVVD